MTDHTGIQGAPMASDLPRHQADIAAAAAPTFTGVATALREAGLLASRMSREIAANVERLKVDAARIDLSPLAAAFPATETRRGR